MVQGSFTEEEVQCPLCLRYHNIQRKSTADEEEEKPSIGEVFGGTVKVVGAAGAVAMLLSRQAACSKLSQTESLAPKSLLSCLSTTKGGEISPNFGRIAMGTMIFTGMVLTVWSWLYKQKVRRQREEEFRGTLEICKECWTGIREVLLNGDY